MTTNDTEHADERDEPLPTDYGSALAAARTILSYGRLFPDKVDWPAAAAAISADPGGLNLNGPSLRALEGLLRHAPNDTRTGIRDSMRHWGEANWTAVVDDLRAEAVKRFSQNPGTYDQEFSEFVACWPLLKTDRPLVTATVVALQSGPLSVDTGVQRLRMLKGDRTAAADVLAVVMAPKAPSLLAPDELASLFAEWDGTGTWGQLQHLIWRCGKESYRQQTVLNLPPDSAVVRAAGLLREFGLTVGETAGYSLGELSPETRASWRREMRNIAGDDPELRHAVTEALLWYATTHADRAVLFAVWELCGDHVEAELAPFMEHSGLLVRRRAAAVLGMARGEPDAVPLLRRRRAAMAPSRPADDDLVGRSRTWIGDARIEQFIRDTLGDAAHDAGADVGQTLRSGEPTHVPVLFERLRAAFRSISDDLAALAAETDANERLALRLDHRIVGQPEEGGPGVGTARFSADVCLLFEARDSGRTFARRASLIQAKRLHRRGQAPVVDYYPVDATQLADLAGQTMASFLLLIGPQNDGVSIPVIPARLFLDMIERGEPSTQVAPPDAARLGRGISDWLVDDVIGLRTGDWDEAILKRAQGGEDREPFLLVEIIADRIRKGPDGWST